MAAMPDFTEEITAKAFAARRQHDAKLNGIVEALVKHGIDLSSLLLRVYPQGLHEEKRAFDEIVVRVYRPEVVSR